MVKIRKKIVLVIFGLIIGMFFLPIIEAENSDNGPPVADANGPYVGYEGSMVTFNASESYDPDNDPLRFRWNIDPEPGPLTREPIFNPEAYWTWFDDFIGDATVVVFDDHDHSDTDSTTVTIYNVDPVIGYFNVPIDPVEINTEILVSAGFSDQGIFDTHAATIDWGDGTTTEGVIIENLGSGTITGNHQYLEPGVFTITLTVLDDDGGIDIEFFRFIVVYSDDLNTDSGFITGGGWFNSPEGAFPSDASLVGKASFGFVSKIKKGQNIPTGNTEFQFRAGDINFHSKEYQWLIVAGAKAMFKGDGTINNEGIYGFMISAIDGHLKNNGVDMFRIKIWDKTNDEIIYDNNLGLLTNDDPATEIDGGQIVIHK